MRWRSGLRKRAIASACSPIRGFAVHAFVYVAVVALLFGVNIAAGKHHWWAVWVALGWGVGVTVHSWAALLNRRRPTPSSERRSEP
jgi:hypothetical protein